MKLNLQITALMLFALVNLNAQETSSEPKGKISGKVYFDYHLDETKGAEQKNVYELTRAYLGYNYTINDKFKATVLFDAGKNSGGSAYTIFIKNAKLDYKANDWLTLTAGIFGTVQFKDQESFWGYRYLLKSLEDEYKFGTSADVGLMASIKISDKLRMDLSSINGEGYQNLQDPAGKTRFAADLVYTPSKDWVFKAYFDTMDGNDVDNDTKITTISNIALFAGYRFKDRFRLGAEYNLMQNGIDYRNPANGKDLQGISLYSTYNINDKWDVFGRHDILSSNKIEGETTDWHYNEDGNVSVVGCEFKPTKGVNTSINYRYTDFKNSLNNNASLFYFNLEFYF